MTGEVVVVRIKEDVHYTLKDRLGRFAMSGAPSSSRLPYDCHGALERSSICTLFCFMATCVAAAAMTPTSSAQSERTAMLYKVTWTELELHV